MVRSHLLPTSKSGPKTFNRGNSTVRTQKNTKVKKIVLTLITTTILALSAHAQVGSTYQEFRQHGCGKGQWDQSNRTYTFHGETYIITASFAGKYCDMVLYSHANGGPFTKSEITGLVHRTWNGKWWAVQGTDAIAAWGVNVSNNTGSLNLYAMLFYNTQYLGDSGFNRKTQALMVGTQQAFQARGYWKNNQTAEQPDQDQDEGGDVTYE